MARVPERWGSEVLDYFVLIYLGRGPGSARSWCLETLRIYCWGMGMRPGSPALDHRKLLMWSVGNGTGWNWNAPRCCYMASHAHQTLLFFRDSSVKDTSFVEKMKKTVSFHYICTLPNESWPGRCLGGTPEGQLHWTGGGRREPRPGSLVCTCSSNQSPKVALPLLGEFTLFLKVYFLKKPNYKNRPSL